MPQDVIIVGAGVIGLATALELQRHGASVSLLERGEAGRESSWAGGGILFPLLPWDYSEPVTRLTQFSDELFPEWVADLVERTGVDPQYMRSGMLVLPKYHEEAATVWCHAHSYQMERIRSKGVSPGLALDVEALWLPKVAQVRNPRLLQALRSALQESGARLIENTEVTGLRSSGERVLAVKTTKGEFSAENYVVAGGAWSRLILGPYALQLDIQPVRGQMLLFKAQPGSLSAIILQNGIYLIPRRDGHILVGSTLEYAGFDKSTTAEAREALLSVARSLLPQLTGDLLVTHWAGLRPGSPENIPAIGRHPAIENLYVNTGHFRYGVTMAPASAHLLANLLFGLPQPFDISPYRWPVRTSEVSVENKL